MILNHSNADATKREPTTVCIDEEILHSASFSNSFYANLTATYICLTL